MKKICIMIDKLKDLFRKKEYYQLDYEGLNNYKVEFKEIKNEDLNKIKLVIESFSEATLINDIKSRLFENDAHTFNNFDELKTAIKNCVSQDYKETYFEANEENWNFNYFLTNSNGVYKSVLFIYNRIHHNNDNLGDVMYPVLAVKKYNEKLYFWNLLDDNDTKHSSSKITTKWFQSRNL